MSMTRKSVPLNTIRLSVVVTVFSETFSIDETIKILLGNNRGVHSGNHAADVAPGFGEDLLDLPAMGSAGARVKVVVQQNNPGIGWAYREGMEAAKGNYVALMAADLETEPAAVDRMVQKLVETGCDEVIANRWMPGGGFTNYDPLKLVLNWIFQKAFRVLFWTASVTSPSD